MTPADLSSLCLAKCSYIVCLSRYESLRESQSGCYLGGELNPMWRRNRQAPGKADCVARFAFHPLARPPRLFTRPPHILPSNHVQRLGSAESEPAATAAGPAAASVWPASSEHRLWRNNNRYDSLSSTSCLDAQRSSFHRFRANERFWRNTATTCDRSIRTDSESTSDEYLW